MAQDALRDGFVRLCFDPSLNLLGTKCRVVIEGEFYDDGGGSAVTADTLTKVTAVGSIDENFGAGSILSTGLKAAANCCGNDSVEIFALPRASVGVAAEYTATVVGTATTDGRVDIYWGDSQWNISVGVTTGDTPTVIAAAIQAAVPVDFPYSATAALGVVTLTARNAGALGNFLNAEVNWHGRNGYLPAGVAVTFAQPTAGTGTPVALDYSAVLGECCVCCFALLSDDTTWQKALSDYFDDAWSCDSPQCFGHGYVINTGTVGQILATDTNAAGLSRLAHCDAHPNFPWLRVAAYAAKSCCVTVDNPEISIQGANYGVLDCLKAPESCMSCFTWPEQEQLRDGGFVVAVPVSGGEGALSSEQITNDITNNRFDAEGRENLTFQSVSSRRLATATATAIAKELKRFNGVGYYTSGTTIRAGVIGTNKNAILGHMRVWVKSQEGILFSAFENLKTDLTIQDDFEVAPRCQGVPGKLYMNLVYRPPVRTRSVTVNIAPKLLSNC